MPNTIYSAYLGRIKNVILYPQVKDELVDALHKHTSVDSVIYKELEDFDIGIEVNSFAPLDSEKQVLINTFIRGYLACLDSELEYVSP